jgi:hypothetical protein
MNIGAGHGAGHAGEAQDALTAHLAVKDELFAEYFQRQDQARNAIVAQPGKEGIEGMEEPLSNTVGPLQRPWMILDPTSEAHGRLSADDLLCQQACHELTGSSFGVERGLSLRQRLRFCVNDTIAWMGLV